MNLQGTEMDMARYKIDISGYSHIEVTEDDEADALLKAQKSVSALAMRTM